MTKSEYIEYRLGTKKDVESTRHLTGDAYANSVLSGMTELELSGTEGAMWHRMHEGTDFLLVWKLQSWFSKRNN